MSESHITGESDPTVLASARTTRRDRRERLAHDERSGQRIRTL